MLQFLSSLQIRGFLQLQKHPREWSPSLYTKLNYNSHAVFTHRPKAIHLSLALGASAMGLEPVTQGQAWSFAPWHQEDHDALDLGSGISRFSLCTLCQLVACRQWGQWDGQLRDHGNQWGSFLSALLSVPKGCTPIVGNHCCVHAFSRKQETNSPVKFEQRAKFIYPTSLGHALHIYSSW